MLNFLKRVVKKKLLIYVLNISVNILVIYFQIWGQEKLDIKEKVILQKYVKTKDNITITMDTENLVYLLDGYITKSTTLKMPKGIGLNKENKEILLENIITYISTNYPKSTILKSNNDEILVDLGYTKRQINFLGWEKVRMVLFVAGSKDDYKLYLIATVKIASGNPFLPPPSKEFTQLESEYAHNVKEYLERFLAELGKAISEPKTDTRD
ncbi:MAG: hypothetical protein PX635_02860 [Nostocales cyanobacterium LE14-WE12]|nr:hypothetical protein [Nostocales cyanobacterium LE14-WE12]